MNQALIPLEQYTAGGGYDLSGAFDPSGADVYGANGEKMGRVHTAMVEPDTGKLRYLLVDTGGFFSNKRVLVPVGLARIESDDAVYIDSLTKDQLKGLQEYHEGMDYSWDTMAQDERTLTGRDAAPARDGRYDYRDQTDKTFRTP
ncbi:MAG TPA: PRC-barrel domain-containing protein, partial [Deinococcales bacterium]|nr:PRC-barrel domain-containing protein [Deinococcales bacterium]